MNSAALGLRTRVHVVSRGVAAVFEGAAGAWWSSESGAEYTVFGDRVKFWSEASSYVSSGVTKSCCSGS